MKRIKFYGENHFWKVRAEDDKFMICAWRNFYTICDKQEQIRGKDNYINAYCDYINCDEMDLREALYRLNMSEGKFIKDCADIPQDIKKRWVETETVFKTITEDKVFLENLEISHRNRVHLLITEVFKILKLKCEEQGIELLKVSAPYTSQTCSRCNIVDENNRHGEKYHCKSCGLKIDADYNASINILNRGVYSPSDIHELKI